MLEIWSSVEIWEEVGPDGVSLGLAGTLPLKGANVTLLASLVWFSKSIVIKGARVSFPLCSGFLSGRSSLLSLYSHRNASESLPNLATREHSFEPPHLSVKESFFIHKAN